MPLDPLIFDNNYFSKVQARNDFIKAGDFDKQFTTIGSYINKSIIPTLNQLISSQTPGSNNPIDANKNLINVGDGTTKWDFPKAEYIADYSLTLTKLVQANAGSILATDNNRIFRPVSPATGGLALIARVQNTPIWKKINGTDSVVDRAITSNKIALQSLIKDNFSFSFERSYIKTIINSQIIQPNTIPTSKIANGAITNYKLSVNMVNILCGINGYAAQLWGNSLPDNFVNDTSFVHNLWSGIPPIDYTKIAPNFKIPANLYNNQVGYKAFTIANLSIGSITSQNIKEKSLDGNRIFAGFRHDRITTRPIGELLERGCIGVEQLPPRYRTKLGL